MPDASLDRIRADVDARLDAFFARKSACISESAPEALVLVESIRALTTRGGKRLRPVVMHAGYACIEAKVHAGLVDASLAMELLQSYLLMQDDWMDGDATRRGGPSAHAALGHLYEPHRAASVAILASDLASSWAEELLATAGFDPARVVAAMRIYAAMHADVVVGQFLDVVGAGDIEDVHCLKTAGYTVRGPLALGATLAGATMEQLGALDRFARPVGVAFQLRDDVLGSFGDPAQTGKAASNDLKTGKRTALIVEARKRLDTAGQVALDAVFGNADATDADVEAIRVLLVACGARAAVEARVDALYTEGLDALEGAPLLDTSRLHALANRLVRRVR